MFGVVAPGLSKFRAGAKELKAIKTAVEGIEMTDEAAKIYSKLGKFNPYKSLKKTLTAPVKEAQQAIKKGQKILRGMKKSPIASRITKEIADMEEMIKTLQKGLAKLTTTAQTHIDAVRKIASSQMKKLATIEAGKELSDAAQAELTLNAKTAKAFGLTARETNILRRLVVKGKITDYGK